jgi:MFS superfamily sulfate permease-like transporter
MVTERNGNYLVKLQKDVSFLNKSILIQELSQIPDGSKIIINATNSKFIDYDIQEVLNDFIASAPSREMTLVIEGYIHHLNEA